MLSSDKDWMQGEIAIYHAEQIINGNDETISSQKNDWGKITIVSDTCVNSHWVASWLAKPEQEYCQCGFNCKIKVNIERNGHKPYEYIVTEKEYNEILNK